MMEKANKNNEDEECMGKEVFGFFGLSLSCVCRHLLQEVAMNQPPESNDTKYVTSVKEETSIEKKKELLQTMKKPERKKKKKKVLCEKKDERCKNVTSEKALISFESKTNSTQNETIPAETTKTCILKRNGGTQPANGASERDGGGMKVTTNTLKLTSHLELNKQTIKMYFSQIAFETNIHVANNGPNPTIKITKNRDNNKNYNDNKVNLESLVTHDVIKTEPNEDTLKTNLSLEHPHNANTTDNSERQREDKSNLESLTSFLFNYITDYTNPISVSINTKSNRNKFMNNNTNNNKKVNQRNNNKRPTKRCSKRYIWVLKWFKVTLKKEVTTRNVAKQHNSHSNNNEHQKHRTVNDRLDNNTINNNNNNCTNSKDNTDYISNKNHINKNNNLNNNINNNNNNNNRNFPAVSLESSYTTYDSIRAKELLLSIPLNLCDDNYKSPQHPQHMNKKISANNNLRIIDNNKNNNNNMNMNNMNMNMNNMNMNKNINNKVNLNNCQISDNPCGNQTHRSSDDPTNNYNHTDKHTDKNTYKHTENHTDKHTYINMASSDTFLGMDGGGNCGSEGVASICLEALTCNDMENKSCVFKENNTYNNNGIGNEDTYKDRTVSVLAACWGEDNDTGCVRNDEEEDGNVDDDVGYVNDVSSVESNINDNINNIASNNSNWKNFKDQQKPKSFSTLTYSQTKAIYRKSAIPKKETWMEDCRGRVKEEVPFGGGEGVVAMPHPSTKEILSLDEIGFFNEKKDFQKHDKVEKVSNDKMALENKEEDFGGVCKTITNISKCKTPQLGRNEEWPVEGNLRKVSLFLKRTDTKQKSVSGSLREAVKNKVSKNDFDQPLKTLLQPKQQKAIGKKEEGLLEEKEMHLEEQKNKKIGERKKKEKWSAQTHEIKVGLLKEQERLDDLNHHVKKFLVNRKVLKKRLLTPKTNIGVVREEEELVLDKCGKSVDPSHKENTNMSTVEVSKDTDKEYNRFYNLENNVPYYVVNKGEPGLMEEDVAVTSSVNKNSQKFSRKPSLTTLLIGILGVMVLLTWVCHALLFAPPPPEDTWSMFFRL